MGETTVAVSTEDNGENSEGATSEIIDGVDAHIAAKDAEDSADEAEASAETSADAALVADAAAYQSIDAAINAGETADVMQARLDQMAEIARAQEQTSTNMLQMFQGMQQNKLNELPEPEQPDNEPEAEPSSGSWYTRKWGR